MLFVWMVSLRRTRTAVIHNMNKVSNPHYFSICASRRVAARGFKNEIQIVVNSPRACFFAMHKRAMSGNENGENTVLFRITCIDDIETLFDAITAFFTPGLRTFELNFDVLGLVLTKLGDEADGSLKAKATTALLPWWNAACASPDNFFSAFGTMPLWTARVPLPLRASIQHGASLRAFLSVKDDDAADARPPRALVPARGRRSSPASPVAAAPSGEGDTEDNANAKAPIRDNAVKKRRRVAGGSAKTIPAPSPDGDDTGMAFTCACIGSSCDAKAEELLEARAELVQTKASLARLTANHRTALSTLETTTTALEASARELRAAAGRIDVAHANTRRVTTERDVARGERFHAWAQLQEARNNGMNRNSELMQKYQVLKRLRDGPVGLLTTAELDSEAMRCRRRFTAIKGAQDMRASSAATTTATSTCDADAGCVICMEEFGGACCRVEVARGCTCIAAICTACSARCMRCPFCRAPAQQ